MLIIRAGENGRFINGEKKSCINSDPEQFNTGQLVICFRANFRDFFLLVPGAFHNSIIPDPMWLFTSITWDLIHTWSGVAAIAAITLHFYIHWKWVYKVIRKYGQAFGKNLKGNPANQPVSAQQAYSRK
jgi:cytochrome b subunit of formate dehydrogenase